MRIAGLLHILDNDGQVDDNTIVSADTLSRAFTFTKYCWDQAYQVFYKYDLSDSSDLKAAKGVLSKLYREYQKSEIDHITGRDILRMCRSFKNKDDLDKILKILMDHGYLAHTKKGKSDIYYLSKDFIAEFREK